MTSINRKLSNIEQSMIYVTLAQSIEVLVPHKPKEAPDQIGVHRYLRDITDQSIAEALELPVDTVTYRRRNTYGELEKQPELPGMVDDLALREAILRIHRLEQLCTEQQQSIVSLNERLDALTKGVDDTDELVNDIAQKVDSHEKNAEQLIAKCERLEDQIHTIVRAARDRGGELDKLLSQQAREMLSLERQMKELTSQIPVDGGGNDALARMTQEISLIARRMDALELMTGQGEAA